MTFEDFYKKYKEECNLQICEPPAYLYQKSQGEYTIEDFDNIPETRWMELINGEFVYMAKPTREHQVFELHIGMALEQFILSKNGICHTFIERAVIPNPVDKKTELVPDISVLCDDSKEQGYHILGCPDLVIEILSPSTRHRDLGIKKKKYQDGGVREYWTVDLEKECVLVNDFEKRDQVRWYSFNDKVPVGIFDHQCLVDFDFIKKRCEM